MNKKILTSFAIIALAAGAAYASAPIRVTGTTAKGASPARSATTSKTIKPTSVSTSGIRAPTVSMGLGGSGGTGGGSGSGGGGGAGGTGGHSSSYATQAELDALTIIINNIESEIAGLDLSNIVKTMGGNTMSGSYTVTGTLTVPTQPIP